MNISENVRRQILNNLIILGECFGTNGRAVDFVNRVAPYYKNISDLERHMDRFKDRTLDQLFMMNWDCSRVNRQNVGLMRACR